MMMISADELRTIALNVVSENQKEANIDDDDANMTYTIAYNDGVIDLMNAILEKKGETI